MLKIKCVCFSILVVMSLLISVMFSTGDLLEINCVPPTLEDTGSSYVIEDANEVIIGNDHLEIALAKFSGGGIHRIIDKASSEDMRGNKGPAPLILMIHYWDGNGFDTVIQWDAETITYSHETTPTGAEVVIEYERFRGNSLGATVTVYLENEATMAEFGLDIHNDEDFIVRTLYFPVVWGLGAIGGDPTTDEIFYPLGDGLVLRDPLSHGEFNMMEIYPSTSTMQVMAHYDPDVAGLFMATNDISGHPKRPSLGWMSWAETNQGGIGNAINLANQQANLVMENSETGVWLNLVHTMEVDYHETGEDLDTDLTRLAYKNGYMDDIHDLRDYHGADLVSMFIKTSGNIAGMAYGPTEEYHLIPNAAFSVVGVQHASSNYVYIHELGHHFGAGHAKDQDIYPGPQLYDYSAGWRWITGTWPGRRRYRTVMAYNTFDYGLFDYECVPYFSNPDITHWDNDEPIGCYVDANNARTIRETKHIIANYQQPTPQVTTATVSGGQEFYEGTEQEIRWDTISGNNGIAGIDIYLLSLYSNEQMQIARGIRDTGSYLWSVPNEPGDFTIMVRATDRAGFSRTTSVDHPFEILEDNYPPEIEIISPDFGDIFNYNRISVSWNGNDDYSGIDHYEIRTLCLPWVRVDSESFTLDIDIDGHNTIYVMARDRACNTNTDTVDLLLDTQEPYVHIYFPIPLSVIQTPDVEVKWDGFDLLSGVSHYEISLNGGDFERIYNTTHTFLDVDEGDHNVTIRAFDNAGNVATTYVEFTVEDRSSLDFIIDLIDSNSWTWIFIIFLTSSLLGLIVISIDKNRKKYSYPHKNWSRTNEVECGNCFTTIASHYTSCPRCGVDFRHDMVKCNNCSSMVDSRASRCPECGLYF